MDTGVSESRTRAETGATTRRRAARWGHRAVLATTRGPLGAVWIAGYELTARLVIRLLTRRECGVTALVRAGRGDLVPGVSDIDLTIGTTDEITAARIRGRWLRLAQRVPPLTRVVDPPVVLPRRILDAVTLATPFTIGLETGGYAAYRRDPAFFDRVRALERAGPGGPLDPPGAGPAGRGRDAELCDGWLELVWLWRIAFRASVDHDQPHSAFLCVKLVADPVRMWLALEHGIRTRTRGEALDAGARLLPAEGEAIARAAWLLRSLPRAPRAPFAETLPAFVRLSERLARLLDDDASARPGASVRLAGAGQRRAGALPLCDWRALVVADGGAEWIWPSEDDPADAHLLRVSTLAEPPLRRLTSGALAVVPAYDYAGSRLRAVSSRTTDPVTAALAAGSFTASFPGIRGWALEDVAARAVAEQRAGLSPRVSAGVSRPEVLLLAARAALLAASIGDADPVIPVTLEATAELLETWAPGAADAATTALRGGSPAALAALRDAVVSLPAFR